jgi:hypothetical protein
VKQDLASELPHMRAYAFCVAGCRNLADEAIVITLRDIGNRSNPRGSSKTTLYRLLNKAIEKAFRARNSGSNGAIAAANPLLSFPLRQRQLIGLIGLRGFELEEAASVLALPTENIQSLYEGALRRLAVCGETEAA